MKDLRAIGTKLRKLREQKGLTLAEVAVAINKSTSLIGSVERADRCPSLPSLIELAEYYNVPLSYLFEDDLYQYQIQIGQYLQTKLTEKNMSIAELSKLTGLNYFKLADFFQGSTPLTLGELKLIAAIVHVPIKEIVPQVARHIAHIRHYLVGLGLEEQAIQNIVEYIYSKFEL